MLDSNDRLIQVLERIANALERLSPQEAPNYRRSLKNWQEFDWSDIGAVVMGKDKFGPTVVEWQGKEFKRRSPENAYGAVIFFSRAIGKDGDRTLYERLITFKDSEDKIRPISREAEGVIVEN